MDDLAEGAERVADLRQQAWLRLRRRGCQLSGEGRCREALDCFDRALSLAPDDPETLFWAGQERMHLCDWGRAEEQLAQAWRLNPRLVGCARLLARLWLEQLHRPDLAAELIEQARQQHPAHPALLKAEGDLQLALHEAERAGELFEQALQADPEDCEAQDGLATAYNEWAYELHQQGRTEQAIFLLRRALHVTPDWAGLHVNLGQMFVALQRLRAADREFRLGLEKDPHDPIACFNLARLHRQQGDSHGAAEWYRRALTLDDDYPDARPELASLLYEEEDHAGAAALLEEEVARDPSCSVCHHNLGLALSALGRPDEAQRHLERALDLDPAYFRGHYNLAALHAGQGRLERALEHLEEAFRINPERTGEWLALDRDDFVALGEHPRLLRLLGELRS